MSVQIHQIIYQNKKYLFKSLSPDSLDQNFKEKYKQGFELEYQYMHPLNHAGLPHYYTPDELPPLDELSFSINCSFICMEYCEGIRLSDFLGQINASTASPSSQISNYLLRAICDQIYDILSYLLEHNILYMDLNPNNIILQFDSRKYPHPQVKLIDFTFCKYTNWSGNLLYTPKTCGSITADFYNSAKFSPEQLLTVVFTEFFTHLFYKGCDDYRNYFMLNNTEYTEGIIHHLENCGYNRTVFYPILTAVQESNIDIQLDSFSSWYSNRFIKNLEIIFTK